MKNSNESTQIPKAKHPILVFMGRDPTSEDVNYPWTVWISKEYVPHRIFMGEEGKWKFMGKFYPVEE